LAELLGVGDGAVDFGFGIWDFGFGRAEEKRTTPSAEAAATPPSEGGEPEGFGISDCGFGMAEEKRTTPSAEAAATPHSEGGEPERFGIPDCGFRRAIQLPLTSRQFPVNLQVARFRTQHSLLPSGFSRLQHSQRSKRKG